MFVSIPVLAIVLTVLTAMWGSGVWVAVRQNRRERAREEEMRLLRQVASIVLGPLDPDGGRHHDRGLQARLEVVTALVVGPPDENGVRDRERGLHGISEQHGERLDKHESQDAATHQELLAYSRVFARKLQRVWRAFKWGSDDMILALRQEILREGPTSDEPDVLTETGQHRLHEEVKHELSGRRDKQEGRYSLPERSDKKKY